jgi:hypothetical protein
LSTKNEVTWVVIEVHSFVIIFISPIQEVRNGRDGNWNMECTSTQHTAIYFSARRKLNKQGWIHEFKQFTENGVKATTTFLIVTKYEVSKKKINIK